MKYVIYSIQLIFISALMFLGFGCAHKTIHEYCNEHLNSYKSYDQCYSEISKDMDRPVQTSQNKSLTCTTLGNITTCN